MSTIGLDQINDAIASTLSFPSETGAAAIETQSYDDLTDAIAATPTIQVYFEHMDQNVPGQNRSTFGKTPVRERVITFNVDVLAAERKDIGSDMAITYHLADLVADKLDTLNSPPFFGLEGIKNFTWVADRVIFVYNKNNYSGIRFTLVIYVY